MGHFLTFIIFCRNQYAYVCIAGADVMVTFCQISAKKLAFLQFLQKQAVV
jgi:hypothetical protein